MAPTSPPGATVEVGDLSHRPIVALNCRGVEAIRVDHRPRRMSLAGIAPSSRLPGRWPEQESRAAGTAGVQQEGSRELPAARDESEAGSLNVVGVAGEFRPKSSILQLGSDDDQCDVGKPCEEGPERPQQEACPPK